MNLDDEATGALNGGAPPVPDHSAKYDKVDEFAGGGRPGNDFDPSNHEQPAATISRGESFVSPSMYV
ncbi:hypothetical protein EYF80_056236 [Liparis tanakae]|uniref:Uncharacterized protein n=1 Tax=Liparis tanakae TaxID=230148 RepID=A0A4Z2EYD7_9TELE|nr:hypothetical protein EYF80_056236 [Liparis tanakae]